MESFTFDNLPIDETSNLYDLFIRTITDNNYTRKYTTVLQNEEMRLDLVSKRLTGSYDYVEELMILNNILNRWNIKYGDDIVYIDNMSSLRKIEDYKTNIGLTNKEKKNTRIDPNRQKGVIPTIKPLNLKSLNVDRKSEKIIINNKLQ